MPSRGHGALDVHRVAQILIDALQQGDAPAAKLHGVTTRSVERWRKRMSSDLELHTLVAEKRAKLDEDLAPARRRVQFALLRKIEELVPKAKLKDLAVIAEAYRNISEIDLASEVLNVGKRDPRPRAPAAEAGGSASEKGDGERDTQD